MYTMLKTDVQWMTCLLEMITHCCMSCRNFVWNIIMIEILSSHKNKQHLTDIFCYTSIVYFYNAILYLYTEIKDLRYKTMVGHSGMKSTGSNYKRSGRANKEACITSNIALQDKIERIAGKMCEDRVCQCKRRH